ncbi:methyl-accepting chemotaxis protein [Sagittula sp. S175]|uniref:methyl-accepting chemotaxis protein n=1 Tax=Sagittula sp. S175 TaxID=3415129 RepID=UPI003C7A0289
MNKPVTVADKPQDEVRRAMIDLVAESRSRAVRIALFGEMLHRPDPEGRETEAERANSLKVLLDTIRWLERAHGLLTTFEDPWEEYPTEYVVWLKQFARAEPEAIEALGNMVDVSRAVGQAAETRNGQLGVALRAHDEARRGVFMPAITRLCNRIWAHIDNQRVKERGQAEGAVATTRKALQRMEQIATHVRLVAINAAIEANKLGDDGRGIAFIAAEFKSLAEELQTLSATARNDISSMGKN